MPRDYIRDPLIAPLLRRPFQLVRARVQEGVVAAGYDDIAAAHFNILQHPTPDGMRPSELAARAQMTKQAANRLIRHLEQRGYIRLEADERDQRAHHPHHRQGLGADRHDPRGGRGGGGRVVEALGPAPVRGVEADPEGARLMRLPWEARRFDSPPSMLLDQINLVVQDMNAACAFYRRLGLAINVAPDGRHASAELPNGVTVEFDTTDFVPTWDSAWAGTTGGGAVLGFSLASSEEVDRVYDELIAAGHRPHQRPYDAFFGARYAIVDDPDGHPVGLMSPISPERKFWPPRKPPS